MPGGALGGSGERSVDPAQELGDFQRIRSGVAAVDVRRRHPVGRPGGVLRDCRIDGSGNPAVITGIVAVIGGGGTGLRCGITVAVAVRRWGRRRRAASAGGDRLRTGGCIGPRRSRRRPLRFGAAVTASSASSSTRPVSKAAKPGGTQARAAACISALSPSGGSPAAKACSIALARSGFLFFDRADAQAGLNTERAISRIRPLAMRDHSMSAVGRTCFAKSMSSRATVASSSGRAWGSKASWPFTVRATQAANSACFSACESSRGAPRRTRRRPRS